MVDPGTIGSIASLIFTMASEEALKSTVGEMVKDAYKALKAKISHGAANDVEALERNPASPARRAVVAEAIDALPDDDKISIQALATQLADAMKKSASQGSVGFDLGILEAARVHLGTINVTEGVGFRASHVRTTGDFELKELNVGLSQGKSPQ
jgi:hypothetical protein